MEDDQYVISKHPVSLLPSTPTGKLQTVSDLINLGMIDKTEAMSLLDAPDLERFYDVEFSAKDLAEKLIERIS